MKNKSLQFKERLSNSFWNATEILLHIIFYISVTAEIVLLVYVLWCQSQWTWRKNLKSNKYLAYFKTNTKTPINLGVYFLYFIFLLFLEYVKYFFSYFFINNSVIYFFITILVYFKNCNFNIIFIHIFSWCNN